MEESDDSNTNELEFLQEVMQIHEEINDSHEEINDSIEELVEEVPTSVENDDSSSEIKDTLKIEPTTSKSNEELCEIIDISTSPDIVEIKSPGNDLRNVSQSLSENIDGMTEKVEPLKVVHKENANIICSKEAESKENVNLEYKSAVIDDIEQNSDIFSIESAFNDAVIKETSNDTQKNNIENELNEIMESPNDSFKENSEELKLEGVTSKDCEQILVDRVESHAISTTSTTVTDSNDFYSNIKAIEEDEPTSDNLKQNYLSSSVDKIEKKVNDIPSNIERNLIPSEINQNCEIPSEITKNDTISDLENDDNVCNVIEKDDISFDSIERKEISAADMEKEEVFSIDMENEEISSGDIEKVEINPEDMEKEEFCSDDMENVEISSGNMEKEEICSDDMENVEISSGNMEKEEIYSGDMEKQEISLKEEIFIRVMEKEEISSGDTEKKKMYSGDIENDEISSVDMEKEGISSGDMEKEEISSGDMEKEEISSGDMEKEEISSGDMENQEISSGNIEKEEISSGEMEKEEVSSGDMEKEEISSGDMEKEEISSGDMEKEEISSGVIEKEEFSSGDMEKEEKVTNCTEDCDHISQKIGHIPSDIIKNDKISNSDGDIENEEIVSNIIKKSANSLGAMKRTEVSSGALELNNISIVEEDNERNVVQKEEFNISNNEIPNDKNKSDSRNKSMEEGSSDTEVNQNPSILIKKKNSEKSSTDISIENSTVGEENILEMSPNDNDLLLQEDMVSNNQLLEIDNEQVKTAEDKKIIIKFSSKTKKKNKDLSDLILSKEEIFKKLYPTYSNIIEENKAEESIPAESSDSLDKKVEEESLDIDNFLVDVQMNEDMNLNADDLYEKSVVKTLLEEEREVNSDENENKEDKIVSVDGEEIEKMYATSHLQEKYNLLEDADLQKEEGIDPVSLGLDVVSNLKVVNEEDSLEDLKQKEVKTISKYTILKKGENLSGENCLFTRVVIVGDDYLKKINSFWPKDSSIQPYFFFAKGFTTSELLLHLKENQTFKIDDKVLLVVIPSVDDIIAYETTGATCEDSQKHEEINFPTDAFEKIKIQQLTFIANVNNSKTKFELANKNVCVVFSFFPILNIFKDLEAIFLKEKLKLNDCESCIKRFDPSNLNKLTYFNVYKNLVDYLNQVFFSRKWTQTGVFRHRFFNFRPFRVSYANGCWTSSSNKDCLLDACELSNSLSLFVRGVNQKIDNSEVPLHHDYLEENFPIYIIGDEWLQSVCDKWPEESLVKPYFYFNDDLEVENLENLVLSITCKDQPCIVIVCLGKSNFLENITSPSCYNHAPLSYPSIKEKLIENACNFGMQLGASAEDFLDNVSKRRKHCKVIFTSCFPIFYKDIIKYISEYHLNTTRHKVYHDLVKLDMFTHLKGRSARDAIDKVNQKLKILNRRQGFPSCDIYYLVLKLSVHNEFPIPYYEKSIAPSSNLVGNMSVLVSAYIDGLKKLHHKKKINLVSELYDPKEIENPSEEDLKKEREEILRIPEPIPIKTKSPDRNESPTMEETIFGFDLNDEIENPERNNTAPVEAQAMEDAAYNFTKDDAEKCERNYSVHGSKRNSDYLNNSSTNERLGSSRSRHSRWAPRRSKSKSVESHPRAERANSRSREQLVPQESYRKYPQPSYNRSSPPPRRTRNYYKSRSRSRSNERYSSRRRHSRSKSRDRRSKKESPKEERKSHNKCPWDSKNKTEDEALHKLWEIHNKECEIYRKNPKAHPDFVRLNKMWLDAMMMQGYDPYSSYLNREWEVYWLKKREEIMEASWKERMNRCLSLLRDKNRHSNDSDDEKPSKKSSKSKKSKSKKKKRKRSSSSSSCSSSSSSNDDKKKSKKRKKEKKKSKSEKSEEETLLDKSYSRFMSKSQEFLEKESGSSSSNVVLPPLSTGSIKFCVQDVTDVLSQASSRFGALGPSIVHLHREVMNAIATRKDPLSCIESDAKMLLGLLEGKLQMQIKDTSLNIMQKSILQECLDRLSPFLKSLEEREAKSTFAYDIDIPLIARATIGKSVSEILTFIKNALAYSGVDTEVCQEDLMKLFLAVKEAQVKSDSATKKPNPRTAERYSTIPLQNLPLQSSSSRDDAGPSTSSSAFVRYPETSTGHYKELARINRGMMKITVNTKDFLKMPIKEKMNHFLDYSHRSANEQIILSNHLEKLSAFEPKLAKSIFLLMEMNK